MKKNRKIDLKPIAMNTPRANKMKRRSRLLKLPVIKQIYLKRAYLNGLETQLI